MDPEDKEVTRLDDEVEQAPGDFGKVIDTLHSKQKLPSLRTYQGDMAEFIKSKNESVISIAVKEKERKEEKIEEKEKVKEEVKKEEKVKENLYLTPKPVSSKEGLRINFTMLFLSLLLIGGGVLASFYIFEFIKREPVSEVVIEDKIIPYNNLITLANITKATLGPELAKISPAGGISVIKISDTNGLLFQKVKDLFNFLEISLPATLERTLKNEYVLGIISQNNQTSRFLVISVNDFGQAFSGMLDWEGDMAGDLSFLEDDPQTASTTIPMKPEIFSWKDIIIKNKDTRGLVNEKNKAKIAYTFLDKNTILIISNLSAIGDISSAYASRPVAR